MAAIYSAVSWVEVLYGRDYPKALFFAWGLAALALLLGAFRLAAEFVYRDGRRAEMHRHLGELFPQMSGIYSTETTYRRYAELRDLAQRYGPDFKVLPYFTRANYLTRTRPPLPNDWVAVRETGDDDAPLWRAVEERKPVFFVEKSMLGLIATDPELRFSKQVWERGQKVEEREFFVVVRASGR